MQKGFSVGITSPAPSRRMSGRVRKSGGGGGGGGEEGTEEAEGRKRDSRMRRQSTNTVTTSTGFFPVGDSCLYWHSLRGMELV